MSDIYDIRYNLLLHSSLQTIKNFYHADSISYTILNSAAFWNDKYVTDKVLIPVTGNYTFKRYYIYYQAYKYLDDLVDGHVLVSVINGDNTIVLNYDDFITENKDIYDLLQHFMNGEVYDLLVLTITFGGKTYARIDCETIPRTFYRQVHRSVDDRLLLRFLQYLLTLGVKITVIDNMPIGKAEKNYRESTTAHYLDFERL